MTRTFTNTNAISLYLIAYGGSSTSDYLISCEYMMPQIEKVGHMTPYTPSTRNESVLYDTSGYSYNGIIPNNSGPEILADSARYSASAHFNAYSKYLELSATPLASMTAGSVSFWLKANTVGSSGLLPFTGQSTSHYLMASSSWTGAFYNGTISGTITYYIDGVVDNTPPGADGKWHHYCATGFNISSWTRLLLNNYGNSSSWSGSNIYYSDIRFYNTILSAQDIQDLYNAPIKIAKSGTLITNGEVVE